MKPVFYTLLIIFFSTIYTYSQNILSLEFLKDTTPIGKQYIRLIFHADSLYKARNFHEAVIAYNEAYTIKPKQQYPRFKSEDIRTLYLKNDIAKVENKKKEPTEYAWAKRHREKIEREENKKLIAEGKPIKEKTKESKNTVITEKKKEPDLKKEPSVIAEKKEEPVKKKTIEIKKEVKSDSLVKEEKQEFKTTPLDEKTKLENEVKLEAYEKLKEKEETEKKQVTDYQNHVKKEEQQTITPIKAKEEKEIVTISDIIIQKSKDEEDKRMKNNFSNSVNTKPEDEQKILAAKYPREKTEETIKETTKTTTQIIINNNGVVTIYSKVAHNWGQTFYFVKEPASQIRNISRDYFERFTK